MAEQYIYAAARIHAMENALLSMQDIEQLLSLKSYNDCVNMLLEKGYDCGSAESVDEIIKNERIKLRKLISELTDDMSVFDIFLYENDFHNLKAAIKLLVSGDKAERVFINDATVPVELIEKAVEEKDYSCLPEFLRGAAEKAQLALLETGDGGLCDVIVDKAYLEELVRAGERQENQFLKDYANTCAALADIRIAVRGARLEKTQEFFMRSLAECPGIDAAALAAAAAKGTDELCEYLETTRFSEAAAMAKESFAAFEKWCDDVLMREIKKQKSDLFTVAPIAAFWLGKEAELKAVGLVLTAKQNHLDENVIRERLRELYV